MAFEVLATIVGDITDQSEAETLARDIASAITRARVLGCLVQIRDLRLDREIRRVAVPFPLPQRE